MFSITNKCKEFKSIFVNFVVFVYLKLPSLFTYYYELYQSLALIALITLLIVLKLYLKLLEHDTRVNNYLAYTK